MSTPLESFERAFRDRVVGCVRTCKCGKVYYHADERGYDWEPGEYESLETHGAIPLDYSVETITIDGDERCIDCDCWKIKAEGIIHWLTRNRQRVGAFYALERERLMEQAKTFPEINQ